LKNYFSNHYKKKNIIKYGGKILTDEDIEVLCQQRLKSQREYYVQNKEKILQKDKLRYEKKKQQTFETKYKLYIDNVIMKYQQK
jgi:hypothetical protein